MLAHAAESCKLDLELLERQALADKAAPIVEGKQLQRHIAASAHGPALMISVLHWQSN